jgi:biotin-(acetyl-CoA carboxylase) ligase
MELDESRLPLDLRRVQAALEANGWTGPAPVLRVSVASTLDAIGAQSAAGAPGMTTVAADATDAELGPFSGSRLPPGGALWLSMQTGTIRPDDGPGWATLLASLAAADALRAVASVPAEVGWPDTITITGAMCGGDAGSRPLGAVHTDVLDSGLVVSMVIAVGISSHELPPGTSSVYAEGGSIDRTQILAALLPQLERRLTQWRTGDPQLRHDYRERCQTIGRLMVVPEGHGQVTGVDDMGDLIVDVDGRSHSARRRKSAAIGG